MFLAPQRQKQEGVWVPPAGVSASEPGVVSGLPVYCQRECLARASGIAREGRTVQELELLQILHVTRPVRAVFAAMMTQCAQPWIPFDSC
jgi:hypothetical protein